MAYIGKKPSTQFGALAYYDTFTGDGSTTTFDVTKAMPNGGDNDVTVVVDNVRQEPGATKSYTIGADGNGDIKRVTFNVAPDDGSEIYVINPGRQSSILEVSDNTVSAAKIQSDAVTTAKILDSNVTTAKIAADAITGAKIADDAINSEHITDGSVDNVHLAGSIANAKLANSSITINGTAVSLGGSVTAGTDWQAVVVADGSTQLTAVAGRGYFLDTNNGVIEVKLPSSPSRGDTFIFADYGNNFATNRVVIDTGGKLIDSTQGGVPDSDFNLETNGQVVELVFVDDTSGYLIKQNNAPSDLSADTYENYIEATGGTVSTSGNFKVHVFTGDGCFVQSKGNGPINKLDYLVVAGGAGGGGDGGGGGGAGGFRVSNEYGLPSPLTSPLANPTGLSLTPGTYPVTVGGGGTAGVYSPATCGGDGSNSIFSTITSAGGGHGAKGAPAGAPHNTGGAGGSGGGGTRAGVGGAGNTPPVSPAQGNAGAPGGPSPSGDGGGGAGAAGQNANGNPGADGGIGSFVSPTFAVGCAGTPGPVSCAAYFAGGGGGGADQSPGSGGNGGSGGGGAGGGRPNPSPGTAGTANTGGGGGGAGVPGNANTGGKGIVIIRYQFQAS